MWPRRREPRTRGDRRRRARDARRHPRATRAAGLEAAPTSSPDIVGALDVIVERRRAPVFTAAVGEPTPGHDQALPRARMKVLAMVTTVRQARAVEGIGVDAIVAQGSEAGGHRSLGVKPDRSPPAAFGTLALVPQVVDAVSVPVVAAGGIRRRARARGRAGARRAGRADRHALRLTREGTAADFRKKAVLEAESGGDALNRRRERAVRATSATPISRNMKRRARRCSRPRADALRAGHLRRATGARTRAGWPLATGQSVGLVRELPGGARSWNGSRARPRPCW